jgi:5-methylcytosine-specific restriction endonuclease McrBC regulatory subunit McrC
MYVINIPERGYTDVPRTLWDIISVDSHFWHLVSRGIFSVEQRAAGITRLSGSCYVGRAKIGNDIIIDLQEKIPGSLSVLMAHASQINFRLQNIPSPTTPLGPLIGLLAYQFAEVVSRYASLGRESVYKRARQVGSLIGGRLDITRTICFHARGLRHLAIFEKNVLTYNTAVNFIILAALRQLEFIHRLIPIDQKILARSRALAVLFSDCKNTVMLFGKRSSLIRIAQLEHAKTKDALMRDLLALACIILSHESFEHSVNTLGQAPRSWFLNLENLFETAVRNVLIEVLGNRATVQNGRTSPTSIFALNPLAYQALPDLVIRCDGICTIGDAKYKVAPESAAQSDLYQLLVHASAFHAKTAFLVYPDQNFEVKDPGVAKTQAHVLFFKVSLTKLKEDIERLVSVVINQASATPMQ